MEKLSQVILKPGQDKKFRQGQCWIFQNDIAENSKDVKDGQLIEVRSQKGEFVGRGYWNSESKIVGRIVSFDSKETDLLQPSFFIRRLAQAWAKRKADGFRGSFRLCFGEGDFLPGVVIDYYLIRKSEAEIYQSFVIQTTTLGIERSFQRGNFGWESVIKELLQQGLQEALPLERTAVVLRNDVGARKHEGLEEEPPRIVHAPRDLDVSEVQIAINDLSGGAGLVWLRADLLKGQKTGFFLDQTRNINRLLSYLEHRRDLGGKTIRVLDICCYLGHWSTQIAHFCKRKGIDAEFHLVDVSEKALEMASANAGQFGHKVVTHKQDVLKDWGALALEKFEIVICDPPAFIKSKKDLPTGQPAYTKLNRTACAMTAERGLLVSCSCSGLLTPDLFKQVLLKAQEHYKPQWRLLEEGGLPTDHPRSLGFTEGAYLKMYLFEKAD